MSSAIAALHNSHAKMVSGDPPSHGSAEAVSSSEILHFHPKGLRAFPPELRVRIFTEALVEASKHTYINWGKPPALLLALSADEQLYGEALALFCRIGTIRIVGAEKSGEIPYAACELSSELKLLVKNLKIEFRTLCTDIQSTESTSASESQKRVSPDVNFLTDNNVLTQFPNLQHLILDFTSFVYSEPMMEHLFVNGLGYNKIIHPLLTSLLMEPRQRLHGLTKLSITMCGGTRNQSSMIQNDAWFTGLPFKILQRFEELDLQMIQHGLGVNPKMANVLIVTEQNIYGYGTVPNATGHDLHAWMYQRVLYRINLFRFIGQPVPTSYAVLFRRQVYGNTKAPDVTWFWEADEGKTLKWNENRGEKNWAISLPWDTKPGKTIVWKEDLVWRGSDGTICFLRS